MCFSFTSFSNLILFLFSVLVFICLRDLKNRMIIYIFYSYCMLIWSNFYLFLNYTKKKFFYFIFIFIKKCNKMNILLRQFYDLSEFYNFYYLFNFCRVSMQNLFNCFFEFSVLFNSNHRFINIYRRFLSFFILFSFIPK